MMYNNIYYNNSIFKILNLISYFLFIPIPMTINMLGCIKFAFFY